MNPGPATKYHCPVCTRNVTSRGVSYKCNRCSGWVHAKCSGILNAAQYRRKSDWTYDTCSAPSSQQSPPPTPTPPQFAAPPTEHISDDSTFNVLQLNANGVGNKLTELGVKIPDMKDSLNSYPEEIIAYLKDNSLLISAPKSSVTLFTPDTRQAKTLRSLGIVPNVTDDFGAEMDAHMTPTHITYMTRLTYYQYSNTYNFTHRKSDRKHNTQHTHTHPGSKNKPHSTTSTTSPT